MTRSSTKTRLSEQAERIVREANFAHLATIGDRGEPHVAPVWIDLEDGLLVVNTVRGRRKERNIARDPRVGLSIARQENPYQMISIGGRVVDVTEEGADEHIDRLAKKYLGRDRYPFRQRGEQRLKVYITPEVVKGANE
jgi:PPOX class probable F420-dependent enzyme